MKSLLWTILVVILYSIWTSPVPAFADETDFEFQVEPIFPESQVGSSGYFHVEAQPNETIHLKATVSNESDHEMTVAVHSMNAYSGNQGILYQKEDILSGSEIADQLYYFKKAVSHPEAVVLAPMESKELEFSVKVPDIKGTLLGSLSFQVFKGTETLTADEENSSLLVDQYRAINLGVRVDISESAETPILDFNAPSFSPEQQSIMMPLENKQPVIIESVTGNYTISKQDEPGSTLEGDIPTFKMAPKTKFNYSIDLSANPPSPGTYKVAATFEVNGEKQIFEDMLTIQESEVKEAQDAMAARGEIEESQAPFQWAYLLIGFLVLVIGLLIVAFILYVRKIKNTQTPKTND